MLTVLALAGPVSPALAQQGHAFDAAAAFGARPSVWGMRLSPDGQSVLYLSAKEGQASAVYTVNLATGTTARGAMRASGKPERLLNCDWASNERIVCRVYASYKDPQHTILPLTRLVAFNTDGSNFQVLSKQTSFHSRGVALGGGSVVDWLPDQKGAVLMSRVYLPDDHIGSHLGSSASGLGVDWIDTSKPGNTRRIEPPREDAVEYLSDGNGVVRIMGERRGVHKFMYQDDGVVVWLYRKPGRPEWHPLSEYNFVERTGFFPVAIDRERNIVYGFGKKDGRQAVFSMTLDDAPREDLVYANPDVDVDGLIEIGRQGNVVGASYTTDYTHSVFFEPQTQELLTAVSKGLPPHTRLRVIDASLDGNRVLLFADSDADPGVYYILDRKTRELRTFLVTRAQLEGVRLASVKPMSYPAADGVMVPAYLTLPPGVDDPKGIPAIVLPHGGPSARDEWGFDWLSEFFAVRGYAVLRPNFRGSAGYGDAWFEQNGFRSWNVAIGDVLAAGRWLVSQGIANPDKLGIFGWSYGGYAALQSAVVDPGLFKAIVAVAPVTDLEALKAQYARTSAEELASDFIGAGPHVHEGSPIEHVDRFKAPVLLFHGGFDRNVYFEQSKRMCERLTGAGRKCELVSWDELDHYLDDSSARTQMLQRSDDFFRNAFGMK